MLNSVKNRKYFSCEAPCEEKTIREYEEQLGLRFAKDYREYLLKYGAFSFEGHEITGASQKKHLNVLNVTLEDKDFYENIPEDWYVIEETHWDDIVIWQCRTGEIYKSQPGVKGVKLCDSFDEYINMCE